MSCNLQYAVLRRVPFLPAVCVFVVIFNVLYAHPPRCRRLGQAHIPVFESTLCLLGWPMPDSMHTFADGSVSGMLKCAPAAVAIARPFSHMPLGQDVLRGLWRGGQAHRRCPWEQARALALREASREIHGGRANV